MTTPPTHADLLALLRGELSNAEALDTADHLEQCESCRDELARAATGHALITNSARTLGRLPSGTEPKAAHSTAGTADPLPPLADLGRLRRERRRAWVAKGLVAATAAAVLWSGGYAWRGADDSAPIATPPPSASPTPDPTSDPTSGTTRSAVLTPVEGSATGMVTMRDRGSKTAMMRIKTDDLRPTRSGQYYYAWLLDPTTNKMLPLGQVGPNGAASFRVSQRLLASYSAVDVSLETDDGDPSHSPRSVLRAVYA